MTFEDILSDPVLRGFLLVLFVYAIGGAVWLLVRTYTIRNSMAGMLERIGSDSSVGEGIDGTPLANAWRQYKRTFVKSFEKTEEEATQFFNERAVIGGYLNLRYWKAVPNILIGIGILGTFVGLTYGISSFETDSVDTVRASIEELLSGMSTAFVSSIVGMALSIVFNVFEKFRFGQLHHDIQQLCSELDSRYAFTEADRRDMHRREERGLLVELFGYEEDGHEILPAHVLRDLRQEAREQSKTLKSFSTDLADGIMISTLTIEKLGKNLGEAFQLAMQRQLTPTMEGVEDAVQALQKQKAASNEDMVQGVVDQLSNTLEDISGQFRESLSGGAIDQLEHTAETIGETGELLDTFKTGFESMAENLQTALEDMARKTGEEAQLATMSMRQETEAATEKMREETGAAAAAMREQSEGAARALRSEVEKASEHFGGEIRALQRQSAGLLDKQQQNAQTVQGLLQEGNRVAERLKSTASGLDEAIQRMRQMAQALDEAAVNTQKSSKALEVSTMDLKDHRESWLHAEKETLGELTAAVRDMKELSSQYVQQYGTIQNGLKDIFGELEEGLSAYQNTTRESINNYLSSFSKNLQTATNALSGTVLALDEGFEDLHEVLDKLSHQANGQERMN
jgi:uncharacterized protein YoxC